MIVVDTNLVAYLPIPGAHTAATEAVRSADRDWQTPELFRHEWLNVVTLQVREQIINRDSAVRIYRRGISVVQVDGEAPDPVRIINLHLSSECSSYDCQFVALAQRLNVPLITMDQQIVRMFPGIADSVERFTGTS